jgi:hypothetical protein
MITYRFLLPEQVHDVYQRVETYLPDARRNIQAFVQLYLSKDSAFFEVGEYQGVFWFSNVVPGWKADVHINLWDDAVKHQSLEAKRILNQLMHLFRLRHSFASIPALPKFEPALRYTEKVGFSYHGLLPRVDQYEGQRTDMHMLSFAKE